MTLHLILLVAAIVLFVLDAIGIASRVNLQSVGLACLAGALLV